MSAVYTVELRLAYKDEVGITKALYAFISELLQRSPNAFGNKEFGPDSSFEDMIWLMLVKGKANYYCEEEDDGFKLYNTSFNATYSWSGLLDDMFDTLVPYLEDDSYYYQECDSEWDKYVVKSGRKELLRSSWRNRE